MGGEKQDSKGGEGGYVGGFLQLFDWNTKSRKKLFKGKSDLPDHSKQQKRSDGNLPITRLNLMDEDELVPGSSIKGSSECSCASSSVTDEEGFGTGVPGVVARLMGLDSLPASNLAEPFSTPYFDSQSLQDAHYHRRNLAVHHDHPIQKAMEPKPKKMINRPIEKFQTEILPPKSAKSIPITHHKLLSPIKSPSFILSKNAAHIMEAAAKIIIEPGPQATTNKAKMSLTGTSSVPFKVRDLKEKAEVSQKPFRTSEVSSSREPFEANAAKFLKGNAVNKSLNRSMDTTSIRISSDSECCFGIKDKKGRSISLALQAKVNVQRREGLSQRGEQSEVIPCQQFNFQSNIQKNVQKKPSTHNTSRVLRHNSQKQNGLIDKEKLASKSLLSNDSEKVLSGDYFVGRKKKQINRGGKTRVGLSKLSSEVTDSKREVPNSSRKNVPHKKRSVDGSFHLHKTVEPIQYDSDVDRHFTWAEERKRKGLDVVSFTFTAPMKRSISGGEMSMNVSQKNDGFCADDRCRMVLINSDSADGGKLSSNGRNVTGADALSILLEQKLRELTQGVESSSYRTEKLGDQHISKNNKLQGLVQMDECCSDDTETRKLPRYRHFSPISVLEPSFLTESCNSDNSDINSLEGSKQCSSIQALEVFDMGFSKKFHLVKTDSELSDSASSTSTRTVTIRSENESSLSMTHFVGSTTSWELEYVKVILFNVELMFEDFALGRASEIINPRLFDRLENRKDFLESRRNEPKLRRKVLFDCVSECVDLRCRRYASGGFRMWAKGLSTVRRKEGLAKEVYGDISSWRGMGDCMVDDLVDKDMSSYYGKWLTFEVEAFELGVEIEDRILNSLVSEVVADMFPLRCLDHSFSSLPL
ncbi:hypothetical protein U1Q18_029953 [Sarracenia purpurea var. burkii]